MAQFFPAADDNAKTVLGNFVTTWSEIEVSMRFLFRKLVKTDNTATSIIFSNIGTRNRIDILTQLCDSKLSDSFLDDAIRINALKIMEQVKNASLKRNRIIHASWGTVGNELARFYEGINDHNSNLDWNSPEQQSFNAKNIFTVNAIKELTTTFEVIAKDVLDVYKNIPDDTMAHELARRQRLRDDFLALQGIHNPKDYKAN